MSYSIQDLRPLKPRYNNKFNFNLLTLELETKFIELYGSFFKALEAKESNPMMLYDICFLFTDFESKEEMLRAALLSYKGSTEKAANEFVRCLYDSINKSMPLTVNSKRIKEFNDIKNMQNDAVICYAVYYDSLAKRYGHTLDQFYQLTLRQISIMLKTISNKEYDELEIQASLANKKLKPRLQMVEVTEAEESKQDEDAINALKELQKRYQENQGKVI